MKSKSTIPVESAGRKRPRVIFNNDGGFAFHYLPDRRPEDITKVLPFLAEAGVNGFSVLVGIDDDLSWRGSKYAQMWGDNVTCWYPDGVPTDAEGNSLLVSPRVWHKSIANEILHANLVAIIEDGHDLMQLYVDCAHQHNMNIYGSFRMNDAHTCNETRFWVGRSEMKLKRPDLLMGSPVPPGGHGYEWGFSWVWNYAMDEVRERFCGLLDETLTRYDFDGLELDFCRAPPFFRSGEVFKNIETMTDFIRQAHKIVRQHSKQKNRQLQLVVRVPPNVNESLELGLDTLTWVREGLVDVVVMGSTWLCTGEVDIAEAVAAAADSGVAVYTGLEGGTHLTSPQEGYERNQPSVLRAIAMNGYAQGAVGVHVFNYDCHRSCAAWRRGNPIDEDQFKADLKLLGELADPDALGQLTRCYGLAESYSHNGDSTAQVPRKPALLERGAGPAHAMTLTVEDDIQSGMADGRITKAELRLGLVDHESCIDRIRCEVNGEQVQLAGAATISNRLDDTWLCIDNPPIRRGENTVLVVLEGAAAPDPWPVVKQCEVVVMCG